MAICKFEIKIKNTTFEIENVGEDNSYDSFKKSLLSFIKSNPEKSSELTSAISSLDEFPMVNINELNNQSVGLFSPIDLIHSMGWNKDKTAKLLKALPYNKSIKNNIVVGYSTNDVKTRYYNNQLFVNLNYDYDKANKIKALFELSLHDVISDLYPDDIENKYNELSSKLDNNNRNDVIDFVLSKVNAANTVKIPRLKQIIIRAYSNNDLFKKFESHEKSEDIETLSAKNTFEKYNNLDREKNYEGVVSTNIFSLNPGDLIGVNIASSGKYVLEIFVDFDVIDAKTNQFVVKTISKDANGEMATNRRQFNSERIKARYYNPTTIKIEKINSNFDKVEVKTNVARNHKLKVNSLSDLIKSGLVEVGIKVKNKYQFVNPTSIQGSVVKVNNEDIELYDIEKFKIALPTELNSETINKDNINEDDYLVTKIMKIGDIALLKKGKSDSEFVHSLIIGQSNNELDGKTSYVYIQAREKSKDDNDENQKYDYYTGTISGTTRILNLNDSNLITRDEINNVSSTLEVIKSKKHFRDLKYSVSDGFSHVKIEKNSFIVNKKTGSIYKVLEVGGKAIRIAVLDTKGNARFKDLSRDVLYDYYILSNDNINKSFANSNLWKNRAMVTGGDFNVGENIQCKVYINPTTKFIKVISKKGKIDSDLIDFSKEYTKILNSKLNTDLKESDLTMHVVLNSSNNKNYKEIDGNIVKNDAMTTRFDLTKQDFGNSLFQYIVPGSFIRLSGDNNSYIVERKYENNLVISQYGFSSTENNKIFDENLKYVKKHTILLSNNLENATDLFIPNWATNNISAINDILKRDITLNDISPKLSRAIELTDNDSPELIVKMGKLLEDKFKIKINFIGTEDLKNFPNLKNPSEKIKAFVDNSGIYVNLDSASIEEPLHEMLHLVLATMKAQDPNKYYSIVGSIQGHPLFNSVKNDYADINTDILEEVFIRLLTKTFKANIPRNGIFDDIMFAKALRLAINDMLNLTEPIDGEDSIDLLVKPIKTILSDFGSSLIENPEGLIDQENAISMLEISSTLKKLLNNNQLIQVC